MKRKIAIFVSGGGSDMQSVIDACESGAINGDVVCVVSNKAEVYALQRAARHGISAEVFPLGDYSSRECRDAAIAEYLDGFSPDIVVLAGYVAIVSLLLIRKYKGVMINIHPSLIPKFCGKGMYGLKVHEAVLAAGEKVTGATVHYVDEGVDSGTVIRQERVEVMDDDTPSSLQARVLEVEHVILPDVVAQLCAR